LSKTKRCKASARKRQSENNPECAHEIFPCPRKENQYLREGKVYTAQSSASAAGEQVSYRGMIRRSGSCRNGLINISAKGILRASASMRRRPIFLAAGGKQNRHHKNHDDNRHNKKRRRNMHGANPCSLAYQKAPHPQPRRDVFVSHIDLPAHASRYTQPPSTT
jgi:hypothetical protein